MRKIIAGVTLAGASIMAGMESGEFIDDRVFSVQENAQTERFQNLQSCQTQLSDEDLNGKLIAEIPSRCTAFEGEWAKTERQPYRRPEKFLGYALPEESEVEGELSELSENIKGLRRYSLIIGGMVTGLCAFASIEINRNRKEFAPKNRNNDFVIIDSEFYAQLITGAEATQQTVEAEPAKIIDLSNDQILATVD
jgi:hypothetical protein